MITKEVIKSEIDKVQDSYLEVLYRIIEALINPPDWATATPQGTTRTSDWHKFVDDTYGCLADDPIERGDQGQYEIRETIK